MAYNQSSVIFLESIRNHLNEFSISTIWDAISSKYNSSLICKYPGLILDGSVNSSGGLVDNNQYNHLLQSMISCWDSTTKSKVMVFPIFFKNFGRSGKIVHHLTMMYIYMDRVKQKIIINYINVHGSKSKHFNDEVKLLEKIRMDVLGQSDGSLSIRYNIYAGLSIQDVDPSGFCIFYTFLIMDHVFQMFIKQIQLLPAQLIDDMLDKQIFNEAEFNKNVKLHKAGISLMAVMNGNSQVNHLSNTIIKEYISKYMKINYGYDESPTNISASGSGAYMSSFKKNGSNILVKSSIIMHSNPKPIREAIISQRIENLLMTDKSPGYQIINSVRVLESNGISSIVMKHLDGDLSKFLTIMTDEEKKLIIAQLVEGLAYLHRNNIVHGDLKLENVFIDISERKALIADFDCSGYDMYLPMCSTSIFLPPESYSGFPTSVEGWKKLDYWQLGLIIMSIISGTPVESVDIIYNKFSIDQVIYSKNFTRDIVDLDALLKFEPFKREFKK
jgi:serine/threonine protein kinase